MNSPSYNLPVCKQRLKGHDAYVRRKESNRYKKIVHEDLVHCIKITKVNVKKWVDNKIGIV